MPGCVRIGISGWTYKPWRGDFYPKASRKKASSPTPPDFSLHRDQRHLLLPPTSLQLRTLGRTKLPTISSSPLKASATSLTCSSSQTPSSPRQLLRLRPPRASVQKLGPILWQLPPQFCVQPRAPRSLLQAASARHPRKPPRLARRTTNRLRKAAPSPRHETAPNSATPSKSAIQASCRELHRTYSALTTSLSSAPTPSNGRASWTSPPIFSTAASTAPKSSTPAATATDDSTSGPPRIATWARGEPADRRRIHGQPAARRHRAARDVYVYFDNDAKVHAPKDAQALIHRVNQLLTPTNGRTEKSHSPRKGTQVTK